MGLTSATDFKSVDLLAMVTCEDSDVIVQFRVTGTRHEMHYPLASNSSGRLRLGLLSRNEWRFGEADSEFSELNKFQVELEAPCYSLLLGHGQVRREMVRCFTVLSSWARGLP